MSAARRIRASCLVGLLAAAGLAHAQPAPPVSPAPVVNYEYDANGNPTRQIQAPGVSGFGFTTQTSYDRLERAKDTTDARSGLTQFGYNGREQLTSVTDPRSLVTSYPRNGLGTATQLISPDTGTASHTYDAAGNLKTRTDSRGVLETHTYDALQRRTRIVYSKSGSTSLTYNYTFDQTGTGYANGIGRLTSTSHPAGSTQYTYDPQGRLLTDIQRVNALTGANPAQVSRTVTYTYDAGGNVTSIVYPSGRKLVIAYSGGQPTSMMLAKDSTATPVTLINQLVFDPFGGPKSWHWQMTSGTQLYERVRDSSGRQVRYRIGNTLRDISYDAGDRITAYTHYDATTGTAAPTLDQSFGYDELGRITGVTTSSTTWTIGYDANGNRTGVTTGGVARAYTTEATSNRLTSIANPTRTFGYDTAGNTTSNSANYTSTYNLAGRLATLTKAGATSTFSVDGLGRRVRKFVSAGTGAGAASVVIFAYDQQGQLLGEYSSTGAAIREYVWLGSTPLAMFMPDPANPTVNPPLVYYFHTDHIDTPRAVVDKNNALRWRWLAEPFGTTAPETNPQGIGAFTQNLRFPGQYADSETALYYNYFRDYDSTIGRYAQSDPIGLAGGINTYGYAEGNPSSYVDPTGEVAWGILLAGTDLAWQLYENGGNVKCVNWRDVGLSLLGGGLVSGLLKGAGKVSSSTRYASALREYRQAHNVPGRNSPDYQQVHHWAIEANGPIGRHVPDAIKNQPWNLNPVPKNVHDLIHGNAPGGARYGPFLRWWHGTPGWAKSAEAGAVTAVFGPGGECGCRR